MYQTWLENDPNPADRAALQALIDDSAQEAELQDAFNGELEFGTAGLRGKMGPGPNRMNTAVIRRATWGLTKCLAEVTGPGLKVVIGFDGRHHSAEFAREAAGVVTALGGQAHLMPHICPTPLIAFAMGEYEADAGIMVTASHNPAQDNGYKVYLGGRIVSGAGARAQLVAPWDRKIFAQIQAAPAAKDVPCATEGWQLIAEDIFAKYTAQVSTLVQPEAPRDLNLVLTSMHGVGAEVCEGALAATGFTQVSPVEAQRRPDPDFPTVSFPNPEEAGALDLAMELAAQVNADLIAANDPDADRCAVAVPDSGAARGWRQLTGDETGAIFGEFIGRDFAAGRLAPRPDGQEASMARSLVSGELLDKIAASHGVAPKVSLTGFKWIARTPGIIFGYEEAIGFCVDPDAVHDKDGISATVKMAGIAAGLKAEGLSFDDLLDDLALRHGLHVTSPLTFRVADLSLIAEGMRRLRADGLADFGGEAVTFSLDLKGNQMPAEGQTSVAAGWENLHLLPPTDALFFGTASGSRVVVRPSGTEPKLKCYLQIVIPDVDRASLAQAKAEAAARLNDIKPALSKVLGF